LLFGVVFISTLFFCKRLPVLPVFVVINNAVQYRSRVKWRRLIWPTMYHVSGFVRFSFFYIRG